MTALFFSIVLMQVSIQTSYSIRNEYDFQQVRLGRSGLALVITGIYGICLGSVILIPDKTKKLEIQESKDGNIWDYIRWRRVNMVFVSTVMLIICLLIIHFSYSILYATYMQAVMAGLEICGMVMEEIFKAKLGDELLLFPFAITIAAFNGIVTFGAADFIDFITGYFIGFGMLIGGRVYVDHLANLITDKIMEYLEKIQK